MRAQQLRASPMNRLFLPPYLQPWNLIRLTGRFPGSRQSWGSSRLCRAPTLTPIFRVYIRIRVTYSRSRCIKHGSFTATAGRAQSRIIACYTHVIKALCFSPERWFKGNDNTTSWWTWDMKEYCVIKKFCVDYCCIYLSHSCSLSDALINRGRL